MSTALEREHERSRQIVVRLVTAAKTYAEDTASGPRFDELMEAAQCFGVQSDKEWAGEVGAAEEECEKLRAQLAEAVRLLTMADKWLGQAEYDRKGQPIVDYLQNEIAAFLLATVKGGDRGR